MTEEKQLEMLRRRAERRGVFEKAKKIHKALHKKYSKPLGISMKNEMVTISRQEYERLKMQANIDVELLKQLVESFKNIKASRVRRVK